MDLGVRCRREMREAPGLTQRSGTAEWENLDQGSTTTVPVMKGCGEQWYGKLPSWSKVRP